MKILDTNDLLDAAADVLSADELQSIAQLMEAATSILAQRLAVALGVSLHDVSHQPGFGGLCASFAPRLNGQPCLSALQDGDPGGDWDDTELPGAAS